MLPKEKRLRGTKDFKRVYQKGSFFSGALISFNYLPNRLPITRIGIVVSKKISKKAVERNQIKRRVREAARSLYAKAPKGYDIIVNVKQKAKSASVKELESELAGFLGRVK